MLFSLKWLSEYVDLPPTQELRQLIEQHSFEVEGIEEFGAEIDKNIVVAEVLTYDKHPNADRLRVVSLKLNGQIISPVVCGAHNFEAGDKVCFAKPGAKLASQDAKKELIIQKTVIRGVESLGMICSPLELGIAPDHKGILVLPENAQPGKSVWNILHDTLIDINVGATNRADIQSYYGMARELSVITGNSLKTDDSKPINFRGVSPVSIKIKAKSDCPRYTGAFLRNIKVGRTPGWLALKLLRNGIDTINNVVDITNYVMLETGLPVHAFDAAGLKGVVVRRAVKGEQTRTLADDSPREIPEGTLLICDQDNQPIAVAGVIGSAGDRAISAATTEVFVEAAKFSPLAVRASSRNLGLRTESVVRFIKELSIDLPPRTLNRAVEFLTQDGGTMVGATDVFPEKSTTRVSSIKLVPAEVERLLGIKLTPGKIKSILTKNGFIVAAGAKDPIKTQPPYWRTDIQIPEDLIEEIGRLVGYDNIGPRPPLVILESKIHQSRVVRNYGTIQDSLVFSGFWENKNYSFTSQTLLRHFRQPENTLLELANPLDASQKYLRPNLLPGLAVSAARNFRKYNLPMNYFEIGGIFNKNGLNTEKMMQTNVAAVRVSDGDAQQTLSLIKGALLKMLSDLNILNVRMVPEKLAVCDTERACAIIKAGEVKIGELGLISPLITREIGIKTGNVAFFEVYNLENTLGKMQRKTYAPPPKFPSVTLDLSFVIDEDVLWQDVEKIIKQTDEQTGGLISNTELLDIFRHQQKIGTNKKSISLRLTFQAAERTLTDKEVKQILDRISSALQSELGASIR